MVIAGIGCRRRCPADDIVAVLRAAASAAVCTIDAIAAPAFKWDEPGLHAAAAKLGLQLHFIGHAELLAAQPGCVTHSAFALATTGLASVAEAAALAALPGGSLILPRITVGHATCALSQKEEATTEDTENTKDMRFRPEGLAQPARQQQTACGARISVSSVSSVVHLALVYEPDLTSPWPGPRP